MENLTADRKENGQARLDDAAKVLKKPAKAGSLGLKIGAAAAVVALGVGGYLYSTRGRVSTDDAYVEGHVVPVSAKVKGHLARVLVDDNQTVEKGQVLAEIETADYATARDRAQAKVRGAAARLKQSRADLTRYQALAAHDEATRQTLENAEAAAESAEADAAAASADLKQAELDLSYTKIEAPQAGRVTRKSLEEGAFVNPGQALLAIVPAKVWVVANFKETELRGMRPGERAEIKVDAGSGVLTGRVDSIQSGTGARFSLLPPENATGNYVKVVQRVPVKIVLDDANQAGLLAPGLSVEVTVRVN
jgi:membrane fusion protein (multidrug efflux system)